MMPKCDAPKTVRCLLAGCNQRRFCSLAGFIMLPGVDADGGRTGSQAVSHTLALLMASLGPVILHMAGVIYFVGALILGLAFLWFAVQFSSRLTLQRARQLFFISIIYLP